MLYKDSKENNITTLEEWNNSFYRDSSKSSHWKEGYSAYSIADFMLNNNGEVFISKLISDILNEEIVLEKAYPEHEIRFDGFGQGRIHDLGIYGNTISSENKKTIFIGVESKVNESFNDTIAKVYLKSKIKDLNKVSSNSSKRVETLLKRHFKLVNQEVFKLRYQLLYSTIGTIEAKCDISILLIICFKSKYYNKVKALSNYNDYLKFIQSLNAIKKYSKNGIDVYEIIIEEKKLYSIYYTHSL